MNVVIKGIEKSRESAGSDQANSKYCWKEEQSKLKLVFMWRQIQLVITRQIYVSVLIERKTQKTCLQRSSKSTSLRSVVAFKQNMQIMGQ